MPGHFLAAIGQYPELACDGLIGWGKTFSSPICPGKDTTLEFCQNVFKEVFELFPYEYVHMGGDEVEKPTGRNVLFVRNGFVRRNWVR